MTGSVTILNYNTNANSIISAAGRISTTEGSADDVYQNSCTNDDGKNIRLINKILSSGHESVLEHVSVNLSFDNVSVFVEQFLIEFRLASFTVKSRRYVDFGTMGYIMPDFYKSETPEADSLKIIYQKHMEYLFDEYNYFIKMGIPKEDARFVLPYSFKSNFYCTVNARELIKIMNEMSSGRGKNYPELVALGKSLLLQCETKLPYLNIVKPHNDLLENMKKHFEDFHANKLEDLQPKNFVTLVSGTEYPENIICKAAALNYGIDNWFTMEMNDAKHQQLIITELLKGGRKRELEQVNFTILFNKVSLAGVTHLVRHRMQAIVIPNYIDVCDYNEYVLPKSIVQAGLEERYKSIYQKSKDIADTLKQKGLYLYHQVYLLLSGMTIPIMTTMNANELYTFIRLRTCNRAQWEIKESADELLIILRKRYPILFSLYGPSCYMKGKCPEGKMTCGMMQDICKLYRAKENE